ncbi:piwi-like protein 1 [Trichonephila inaurata madagascariensis]|uniref:Piwi-like protein 1 n=1 Tax=Trichonephila inaurata madagascariensis TaxID=2747483 RepID=A0A8X7BNZ4_9ARAC|nr:piwi-like protein 1 [Trichonephila inaurata madagascariensis]
MNCGCLGAKYGNLQSDAKRKRLVIFYVGFYISESQVVHLALALRKKNFKPVVSMADQPRKGRGRGWGRGRAAARGGGGDKQEPPRQVRRPGEEPARQPQMPPPADTQPGAQAGGRRAHRGVPREDPPQQQMQSLVETQEARLAESMAAMNIEAASGRGRSRFVGEGYVKPESSLGLEAASGRGRSRVFGDDNTRPPHCADKKGLSGERISIVANYFELLSRPTWAVFQYHVDFAPLVESSRLRHAFIRDHKETLGDCFLFDGMSDLKTVKKIESGTELFSIRKTDDETIRITLKFVTELAPRHPELQRLFNTQMRRNLRHLRYQLLGRHYFDQSAIKEIPEYNLQIWQGVITSIRTQEEKLMMSVDTVHKVVRKETALQIIIEKARRDRQYYKEHVAKEIVGCVVMTNYNNKTYGIEDVDWSLNPTKTFESREGPLTYLDYYKKQYDITIQDLNQPLLLCRSKEKEIRGGASVSKTVYLIPELCCMTGITDSMRSDFTMMREMSNRTRLDPAQRVANLEKFMYRINSNETIRKEMGAWDLKFSDRLVQFDARLLPKEGIVQGQEKYLYDQKSGDFSREMRGKHMHSARHLDEWVVFCTRQDESKARDFLQSLYKVCPPMGMRVRQPRVINVRDDKTSSFLEAIRTNTFRNTQMVTCIVPNNKKDRYDAIKKTTCLDFAVPSQVIVNRTLTKKQMLMSVATKIGIQLNCKLGGEPWALEIPFKMRVMIIGYDTYHDSSRKGQSAGAFVSSMNANFTRWYSRVTFHSAGGWEELSNHVQINVTQAIKKYREINSCVPDTILYFRDGVGDGQIPYVLEWEVKPFKKVISELLSDKITKSAFIVVNKRINTRFFAPSGKSYMNPPPGTLVDHTVTRFDRYDFYLVSQCVRQGTVAPTMYNVIEDSSGLKPEYMQRISYKLTHLYFNWPGTIRVPAPCQYAHKLAFLVGQSLHQQPREELCESLFYL